MPGRETRSRPRDDRPAAERLAQAARGQQPPRAAARRGEVDAGGARRRPASRASPQLLDQAIRFLDARPWPWWCAPWPRAAATRSRAARCWPATPGRRPGSRRNSSRLLQELAVAPVGLEEAAGVGAARARACGWRRAPGSSGRGSPPGTRARARPSSASSQRMPSTSRWLVGSSISRTSGSRGQLARDGEPLLPAAGERVHAPARPSAKPARPSACAMRPGASIGIVDRASAGGDHAPRRCRPPGTTGSCGT